MAKPDTLGIDDSEAMLCLTGDFILICIQFWKPRTATCHTYFIHVKFKKSQEPTNLTKKNQDNTVFAALALQAELLIPMQVSTWI